MLVVAGLVRQAQLVEADWHLHPVRSGTGRRRVIVNVRGLGRCTKAVVSSVSGVKRNTKSIPALAFASSVNKSEQIAGIHSVLVRD